MSCQNEQNSSSNGQWDANLFGRMMEGESVEASMFPRDAQYTQFAQYRSTDPNDPETEGVGNVSLRSLRIPVAETAGPSMHPNGYLSLGRMIVDAFPDEESLFPEEYARYDNVNTNNLPSETEYSDQQPLPPLSASAEDASLGANTIESSINGNINTTAPESEQHQPVEATNTPINFSSLDRLIAKAFADQDSIYREKNQAPEPQAPNQALSESRSSDSRQPIDIDDIALDNWPNRNIHEDLDLRDLEHPWGLIDYHFLNRLVEETPVQNSVKPGVMVFPGTDCIWFLPYDRIRAEPRQHYGRHPRFIFGLIPLPEEGNSFARRMTLVMYWDCKTKEILARQFRQIPESIQDIWWTWDDGVDVYVFKPDDLAAMLIGSVDSNDGGMVFPSIDGFPWCLEKERHDHPGMQLVILSQAATFMVHMASVLSSDPNTRSQIIDAVRKWRRVLQLSSDALWTSLKSGDSKRDFTQKVMTNKAVTEALGLTHCKVYEKSWLPPMPEELEIAIREWRDASKLRQERLDEEAYARAQNRFEDVFGQRFAPSYPRQARTRIPVSQRFNQEQVVNQTAPQSTSSSITAEEDENIPSVSPRSSSPDSQGVRTTAIHSTLKFPRSRPLPIPGRGSQDSIGHMTLSPGAGSSVAEKVEEPIPRSTSVSSSPGSYDAQAAAGYSSLRIPRTRPRLIAGSGGREYTDQEAHSPGTAGSDTAIELASLPQDEETADARESSRTIRDNIGTNETDYAPDGNPAQEGETNNEQSEVYGYGWPHGNPTTSLSSLIDCLQDFVRRHPEVDTVQNRQNFRIMLTYSGIVMRETGDQPPSVTRYLLNERFHYPRD